jgi:hypothetical protein
MKSILIALPRKPPCKANDSTRAPRTPVCNEGSDGGMFQYRNLWAVKRFIWMLLLLLVDVLSGVLLFGVYAVFSSLLSEVFWL